MRRVLRQHQEAERAGLGASAKPKATPFSPPSEGAGQLQSRCRGEGCTFFGRAETGWMCSVCWKKSGGGASVAPSPPPSTAPPAAVAAPFPSQHNAASLPVGFSLVESRLQIGKKRSNRLAFIRALSLRPPLRTTRLKHVFAAVSKDWQHFRRVSKCQFLVVGGGADPTSGGKRAIPECFRKAAREHGTSTEHVDVLLSATSAERADACVRFLVERLAIMGALGGGQALERLS